MTLSHRVILAPLIRYKSSRPDHVPIVRLMKEYYSQRSSVPGSLLITEATFIAAKAGGYYNIAGIWIALKTAEEKGDLIAFGRFYVSNPDLPTRLKENIPLTPFNPQMFYTRGDQEGVEVGYVDYPFANVNQETDVVEGQL